MLEIINFPRFVETPGVKVQGHQLTDAHPSVGGAQSLEKVPRWHMARIEKPRVCHSMGISTMEVKIGFLTKTK